MRKQKTGNLKNKALQCLSFCFILVASFACVDGEVYYKFEELKEGNWDANHYLHFELDTLLVDKNKSYDVSIEITNNIDFPYQNLWLFFEYNKNDSTTVKREEEFVLADEFGKWDGSGFGSLYQSSHVVLTGVVFDEEREYDIYVRHGMQDSILHGIEKVGIKIEERK